MSDYIARKAVRNELYDADAITMKGVAILNNFPSADVIEVKHGEWEKAEHNGFLRCDQCKDVYINEEWLEDGKWNYCPNCGAKMDL